ncbi:DUF4190 domain-containing protein [Nocardia sp. NPDC005978]|uniref:DUF4190 domain-containing protein n=1 Tax=unclassified Nocardia TaxID=2637762 RepID=UPI0033A09F46
MSYPPPPPSEYNPQGGQYPGQYPAPPPGNYPPPGGQYWQESPKGKGLAIAALVFGIIAVLFCWTIVGGIFGGILAIAFGVIAMVKARKGRAGGFGMAVTGLILGLLGLIASAVIGVVGYKFFEDSGGGDFLDCISNAGGDQTKLDQCERDYKDRIEDRFSITLEPTPTP